MAEIIAPIILDQILQHGTCDSNMADSTTSIFCIDFSGKGNDFYNEKYYLQIISNVNSRGNAPETEIRKITDYLSSTGRFTCDAFTANVQANDQILLLHESVAINKENQESIIAKTNVIDSTADDINLKASSIESIKRLI